MKNRNELTYSIARALHEHPDWLDAAMEGICHGMRLALAAEAELRAKYDLAFRSAIGLAGKDRISAATKEVLNNAIVSAINPKNICESERKILRRIEEDRRSDDAAATPEAGA